MGPEKRFQSAARWAAITLTTVAGTYWALNPPESLALTQLRQINEREQQLSNELYAEGALSVNLGLSPVLTPAWNVQIVDAYNPKMPELSALLKQKRELSEQIADEQGSLQTRLRAALGLLGPMFSILFSLRTVGELIGAAGSRRSQA